MFWTEHCQHVGEVACFIGCRHIENVKEARKRWHMCVSVRDTHARTGTCADLYTTKIERGVGQAKGKDGAGKGIGRGESQGERGGDPAQRLRAYMWVIMLEYLKAT